MSTTSEGLMSLTFAQVEIEKFPTEKQPIELSCWIAGLISELRRLDPIEEEHQAFVVTELNKLVDHVKEKDITVLGSKSIRFSVGKAYELAFSSGHQRQLYETANKYLSIVNSGKPDKYSELKQ